MPGKLLRPTWVTRQDLRDNPNIIYMFGDNMLRQGMGGQAGAMRGEPNAVGVPTKWAPGMSESDFFTDSEFTHQVYTIKNAIDREFSRALRHMKLGGAVAIPADGLGTGLSQLPQRAPAVLAYIETWIESLQSLEEQG